MNSYHEISALFIICDKKVKIEFVGKESSICGEAM